MTAALVPREPSKLPEKLRRKVGQAITTWFEHLGTPSRILYRRSLVHFALWLWDQEAIVLGKEPAARSGTRAAWEDEACLRAGQYLLGFPFHEAVHLCEAYLADCLFSEPKITRATASSRLAALRWATREARRQNLIDWDLQTAKLPRPRKDKQGRLVELGGRDMRGPEREQKELLLRVAEADPDTRVFVALSMALIEGYREHEIRQINFEDLVLPESKVWLVRKKKEKAQRYPLSPTTMRAIRRWLTVRGTDKGPFILGGWHRHLRKKRVGQSTLFVWVQAICRQAKVEHFSPHRLRHRAVTDIVQRAAKKGVPEETVMFLTGISHRSTLMIYYDVDKDVSSMRDLLEEVEAEKPRARKGPRKKR